MKTAGYSGKSLVEKLGIKENCKILILGAPDYYPALIEPLPVGAIVKSAKRGTVDMIHLFVSEQKVLAKEFPTLPKLLDRTVPGSMVWISWPKKSSGVTTDLNENIIREIGLKTGMVDVKVCAIDDIWSGLKFLFRKKESLPKS